MWVHRKYGIYRIVQNLHSIKNNCSYLDVIADVRLNLQKKRMRAMRIECECIKNTEYVEFYKIHIWLKNCSYLAVTRAETDKNIDQRENLSSLHQNFRWEKIRRRVPDHFGTPSYDVREIEPRKDPQERIPQVNYQIGNGWKAREIKHPRCWDTT